MFFFKLFTANKSDLHLNKICRKTISQLAFRDCGYFILKNNNNNKTQKQR